MACVPARGVAVGCPARPHPHPKRQSRTRRGMREIEGLLNMRGNATTIIDLVALLAGPQPHSPGLFPVRVHTAAAGAGLATTADGLDLPGGLHKPRDRLVELLDVLRGKIYLVVGAVHGKRERPLRLRTVNVVSERGSNSLCHARILLSLIR